MENQEVKAAPTVGKTGVRYGIILFLINTVFFLIMVALGVNPYINAWWKTVLNILIVVVLIVMAHNYFKKMGDGYMTFGQGFGIGFISSIISVVLGGLFGLIWSKVIDPGMMTEVWDTMTQKMQEQGRSDQQIQMALSFTKKLFWVFFFVFAGIMSAVFPLIITIFTQKKKPEATF